VEQSLSRSDPPFQARSVLSVHSVPRSSAFLRVLRGSKHFSSAFTAETAETAEGAEVVFKKN
jgi:hypothetical protein